MKPKRFRFRSPQLFGTPLCYGAPVFAGLAVFLTGLNSDARDILRPNAPAGGAAPAAAANGAALTRAATDAARANSQDMLRRTGQTLDAMRAMQAAARAAAQSGPDALGPNLPVVPNGLRPGGLNPAADAATNPARWSGASQPVESVSGENVNVTIRQTTQQALLHWQTLNVGKNTTLTFDQSAGGANVGQWIAFNQVTDPTGNPTQILGRINAAGQVYLMNRNGVIFGGSSQVNARGLTVSSLPINTNLVSQGLLNNRDAQFLFSGLDVPGGADGTPNFIPEPPPASGRYGDVTVQPGAVLTSPASAGGNGGRITLVGANVINAGTISTESGQTVLAAGLQVAMAAHDGNDPSLRGLDVWVGAVGDYAGTVTQAGIIETLTGSASVTGRLINQLGIIESSTSVNLNGRIDLKASYGAVANPNFDSATEQGAGGPMFFNQYTGLVALGGGSVIRILPDYASTKAVPGTSLPERSQVNIEGLAVHLGKGSILLAPNAEVSIRAGVWPYKDADGNRSIFAANGSVEAGITNYYSGANQRFLFDGGQIYVDEGATINVAGSVDVFVPLAQSILEVELRGAELADSPLQRSSNLRGEPLTVDIRQSGAYNGKFWVGTPLGDVTGLAGIIERNAAQLTAAGGDITLQAGGSIVLRQGSVLDVSGGFYTHEGGLVTTSSLLLDGRKVAVKNATPDKVYDGVYSGKSVFSSEKWGITETFSNPLAKGINQKSYNEGADGGTLSLIAPGMALDGELRGLTVEGERQRSNRTVASSLRISFEADRALAVPGSTAINFFKHSPTPPLVMFTDGAAGLSVSEFSLVNDLPAALPAARMATVFLSPELLDEEGFGSLEVNNPDGSIVIPENVMLSAAPKGSVALSAANLSVYGSIIAPGGVLSFTTYNIPPSFATEYSILSPAGSAPFPLPATDRGLFVLGADARLSTAGLIADDTPESPSAVGEAISSIGGEITIKSYNASLAPGGVIDVSGGVYVSDKGSKTYGKAGSLSLITGTDVGFPGVIGGSITLGSTLRGYSGSTGGSLNIQASLIEVGGGSNAGALQLSEDFFRTGGFSKYSLSGVGAKSAEAPPAGLFESYIPAISIAANANLRPLAESLIAEKDPAFGGAFTLTPFVKPDGLRSPVSLSFTALGSDDPFTLDSLEVRGDIVMGAGALILTEPGASVSFKAGTITLLGSVTAPGGKISVAGAGSFPLTTSQRLSVTHALPTVHLGESTRLSAAGVTVLKPDVYGRRVGSVLDGGIISISGNILAEKGGLLDVSGSSGVLDLSPSVLVGSGNRPLYLLCGINIPPCKIQGVATRLDSDGGTIDLSGSQLLYSDATLFGAGGGSTAVGGSLLVSSGRYYGEGDSRTGADINLVVTQSGDVVRNPNATLGVGIGLVDGDGLAYGNSGEFSLSRFKGGSFNNLSLGGNFSSSGAVPFGGNVSFEGDVRLDVPGSLRLAAGGIVTASGDVVITAGYAAVGQGFRAAENPGDNYLPFQQDPAIPSASFLFPPTYGTGKLWVSAELIDIGTLSLQKIGRASFDANRGEVRGNGTLHIAGDLTISASATYPTTGGRFSIFAYDHADGTGSVTFKSSSAGAAPLSAGGTLEVYATTIRQLGNLRAPGGSIILGWDGMDLDPADADLDSPFDSIAGSTIAAPITNSVTLGERSVTSVSLISADDSEIVVPYGLSPDGRSWIDPSGQNISLNGVKAKRVAVSGTNLTMESGSVVDIRGGGDLLANRWISGNGGSVDLLGIAGTAWTEGATYEAGDLVIYQGQTWSARTGSSGETPVISRYWTKVAESFAIIPTSSLLYSPFGAFNTGLTATDSLGGDPGYVDPGLRVGDTVTLEAGGGIPAGTYTLLPRSYAQLSAAYLVTPLTSNGAGGVKAADGSYQISGFLGNRFGAPESEQSNRVRFEISSANVFEQRAEYQRFYGNKFLVELADSAGASGVQHLPGDAGSAIFHGNSGLTLAGKLLTASPGRGASVDISSFADIEVVGNGQTAGSSLGTVSISSGVIDSWDVASLLIGGIRRITADGSTVVEVRTGNLRLANAGSALEGPDIILASNEVLEVAAGSAIRTTGTSDFEAELLSLAGDGALLRVSADPEATVSRSSVTNSGLAKLSIAGNAAFTGGSITLDSTGGMTIASNATFDTDRFVIGSGRISLLLNDTVSPPTGGGQLVLDGAALDSIFTSANVTLRSYGSIDLYGSGLIGRQGLGRLELSASAIRGFDQSGGTATIVADTLVINNSLNSAPVAEAGISSGGLEFLSNRILLGENKLTVSGYDQLTLGASSRLTVEKAGSLHTLGSLTINSPLVTGAAGASHSISSTGIMSLTGSPSKTPAADALGASLSLQGSTIHVDTDILLPSGEIRLTATSGDLTIGGAVSVAGTSRPFNDLTRFTNAGQINLTAKGGDILLNAGATVSVAGDAAGGDAGVLRIEAVSGTFLNLAKLEGSAAAGFSSGSFSLDVSSVDPTGSGSLTALGSSLGSGGFTASRSLRIRTGDVLIDHLVRSHKFSLFADNGSIRVTGRIDATGDTGGSISLAARGDVTLASGSVLSVAGRTFSSAGKGGSILLEAGTQKDGTANTAALLDLQSGSMLDLSVAEFVAGGFTDPGSSAFDGKFTGTLHLRAPRSTGNDDLGIASIGSRITGASSVVAEGYRIYQPSGGILDSALKNQIHADNNSYLGTSGTAGGNGSAIRSRLLAGNPDSGSLDSILVVAPGVEIINPNGNLTLGLANPTGTNSVEGLHTGDWDLSSFRYGEDGAPGILTLRASGDLVFNNTLSDGFTPITQGAANTFADNGHSLMWLATLATINGSLPTNTQSWSYRLTAGADMTSSDFRGVLSSEKLELLHPGRGSILVGEFYPAVPNLASTGTAAAVGSNGQTADSIRISLNTTNRGNRFEVIRTGTGDITASAGRDIQLRNQFSTIYTAGVALPNPTTVFSAGDFVLPVIPSTVNSHPSQAGGAGVTLGAVQQLYPATWSMAGGDISLQAVRNIGRYTLVNGVLTVDSSRQMPTNWLYRRSFVDPSTGLFSNEGGFGTNPNIQNASNINDVATSTTWWIDYSNFFQGIGTLGGGDIDLQAGTDIVNMDSVAPTNARMAGRTKNPAFGTTPGAPEYLNLAPSENRMVEYGGGDITVRAGRNVDGGIFYVERGAGSLTAGGDITTNAARTPSQGILANQAALDPLTWLPTTLFVGKSHFDVVARGDVLLGPVTNPFLLPQGINNRYWYKTYFSTFSGDAGATVSAYGGDVTHRSAVTLPGSSTSRSILEVWFDAQNLFNGVSSGARSSFYQPWTRLVETSLLTFDSVFRLNAPNLTSTSFAGDIRLVGDMTLAPSTNGNLELAASGSIIGLNPTGVGRLNNQPVNIWTSATVNVSDASLSSIPGVLTPLAYQTLAGRDRVAAVQSQIDILQPVSLALTETGSFSGPAGSNVVKQALHGGGLLHGGDSKPVQLNALGGDITGLTLFTPKRATIIAQRDITDVAFYLQNLDETDISLVSAGRDIVPFNESSELRVAATNLGTGNYTGDVQKGTSVGTGSNAETGDLQVSGPGVLEVLAGRNIDLGTGANFFDGTGTGVTSIGNNRNPNLPFAGADLVLMAGVSGVTAGMPARGLAGSSLDFESFIAKYLDESTLANSDYLSNLGINPRFSSLTDEQQAIAALERFYQILRNSGRDSANDPEYSGGYDAVRTLFGQEKPEGDIEVRAREIRTVTGGSISLAVAGGDITLASEVFGNPLTPPGIVTEFGGGISTFTDRDVDIGQARIFTLRGGDIIMWSSNGDIAAGSAPRTVVTAPPTRVLVDISSANVQTDLGGLATGGGIGVLAAVEGVEPGNVDLIAPNGSVDAGDAGIRVTGNLNIAAQTVLNAGNISAGGSSTGTSVAAPSAPSISSVTSASNSAAAANSTMAATEKQQTAAEVKPVEESLSIITVDVIGYGDGAAPEDEEEENDKAGEDAAE